MTSFCVGSFEWDKLINRNHNHAELRNHPEFGDVWVHRKGATHADEGMMGVIPGNMLDGSFIVKGKGNINSLWSSSHGAGRILGRKKAKEVLKLEDFEEVMEGILADVDEKRLDESPFAYKNIFTVMEEQKDLVEIVAHVKPIFNVKG
jgi:tRNA-splicing ligase RtcB